MSTFKFNFYMETEDDVATEKSLSTDEVEWLAAEEVLPLNQVKNFEDYVNHAKVFECGDLEIGHVVPHEIIGKLESKVLDPVILAENENSDLVPGIYEGGLKVWESTKDLIEYLLGNYDKDFTKGSNVLDLGCGAGLLGIYMLLSGASVTFQDYNKDILEYVTIPNVLLNFEEESHECEIKRCKFFSGDWASFITKLADTETFDIILSSETIYNPNNYQKIMDVITKKLKKDGIAYIAAKTHYFGVGGGTRIFETFIEKNSSLKSEVCWRSCGGIQREILKITHEK